eukprot:1025690-Prorocentrum_lima.AAC.1
MEQVTHLMDQTTSRASASELGDVMWLTKIQFLAHQQYRGLRLAAWEKAKEDQKIEKHGSPTPLL